MGAPDLHLRSYIRFVVGSDGEHHRELTGIVTEVRFLRDDDRLSEEECRRLEDAYRWFQDHLPVPPFRRSGWSRDAVCWFTSDAGEPISRMWDLVAILRDHGVPTRMLRSTNPGRVLYEDGLQVVVEEWNRLRALCPPPRQPARAAGRTMTPGDPSGSTGRKPTDS